MAKLKIIDKKLGRNKAWGLCYQGDGLIEIDPRQTPKNYFFTCIHELIHEAFHELSEKEVKRAEKIIGKALWDLNYRKVSQ